MASDPYSNCCQWHNSHYLSQICASSSVPGLPVWAQAQQWVFGTFLHSHTCQDGEIVLQWRTAHTHTQHKSTFGYVICGLVTITQNSCITPHVTLICCERFQSHMLFQRDLHTSTISNRHIFISCPIHGAKSSVRRMAGCFLSCDIQTEECHSLESGGDNSHYKHFH